MKILILLPLLLGFSVPATAHNIFNGGESGFGCGGGCGVYNNAETEEGEEGEEGEGADSMICTPLRKEC